MFKLNFRKIIIGILLGLGMALLVKISFNTIPVLRNVESLTLDHRFRLFTDQTEANKDIVIVVIDQSSLDYLEYPRDQREPQYWPWDRFVYANVLDYLKPLNPKAIVFDLSFKRINEAGDDQFAESIRKSGNVYCAMVFTREKDERYTKTIEESTKQILLNKFAITSELTANLDLSPYNMVIPPNTTLLESPKRLGAVNVNKDRDGVLRKVALFYEYQDKIFPSLPLAVALDVDPNPVRKTVDDGKNDRHKSHDDIMHLSNGAKLENISLTPRGDMYIWWHGRARTYKYIPFSELYDDWYYMKVNKPEEVRFKAEEFKDKIIFIGTNAPTQGDLHTIPLMNAYPGVEAQATVLDNLISGKCLIPAPGNIDWLTILSICLICGLFMFAARSFIAGTVLTSALIVVFLIINFSAFAHWRYWLELAPPLCGVFLTFTSATVIYYFTEGKEKRRIKSFFSKYLSPEVVDEILKDYKNIRAEIGERKELTILFSDIRGFTSISESLPPEKVVTLLNEYLSRMGEIIFRHGGTLDKYIGDGIMVFFGAPKEQINPAQLAVKAAIEMVTESRKLQKKWKQEGNPDLNIGIGINTGEVIVGSIGSEYRLDYTVIGDNVNLAARLEPLNKEYKTNIIISQFTVEKLGKEFNLRELGQVTIRGKEKPVLIYEVKS